MKKTKTSNNYLEYVPTKKALLRYSTDDNGIVTLEKENKGIVNAVAQKLLKKPKISYIHLDEMGSYIWLLIDGKASILQMGQLVKQKFGDDCEPLYERLSQYIKILASNGFVDVD